MISAGVSSKGRYRPRRAILGATLAAALVASSPTWAQTGGISAVNADGPLLDTAPIPNLAVLHEPLGAGAQALVLDPLLAQLHGDDATTVSEREDIGLIMAEVAANPSAIGVISRLSLLSIAEMTSDDGVTVEEELVLGRDISTIELGVTGCLVLVTKEDAPWQAYADLNYPIGEGGARVGATSEAAADVFSALTAQLPLAADVDVVRQAFPLALTALFEDRLDVVAMEVEEPTMWDLGDMPGPLRALSLPLGFVAATGLVEREELGVALTAPLGIVSAQAVCNPYLVAFSSEIAPGLLRRLYLAQQDWSGHTATTGDVTAENEQRGIIDDLSSAIDQLNVIILGN